MGSILPLHPESDVAPDLGALVYAMNRLDDALFAPGQEEDALEKQAREDVAAEALHELLTEYGEARVRTSEAETLERLWDHYDAVDAELVAAFAEWGAA